MKIAVLSLVALALVPGGGRLVPVRFDEGDGWHTGERRVGVCPGIPASRCKQVASWAATVQWVDCFVCIPPHRTLARMRPDDVAIQMSLAAERFRSPPLRWPPRLRAADVVGPIEGGPRRIGFFQRAGRLRGFSASVFVFFGRPHPTRMQLARAERELATARLP